MQTPVLIKPIPLQVVNELAAYGPFDLKNFIQTPDKSALRFSAELVTGTALPKGMICTADGILTGIPAKGTQGNYEIKVQAENEAGSIDATFVFTIKPSLSLPSSEYLGKLKTQVWEALEHNLPLPDLGELYERPITPLEIYYLLERWGILTIWDAFNLEPQGEKVLLDLEGVSPHYDVYDRGTCLVASPKDLYSYERTLEDGLQTARAMAKEVYKRGWTIEMAGFDKLTRAAWIELQHLMEVQGKKIEIINYIPSINDVKLFNTQLVEGKMRSKPE